MSDTIDDIDAEFDDFDLAGQTVAGRYRVIRRIGEGGMGVVYRAIDERINKLMALKVLKEDYSRRQDIVARFTQEAKSAARIKHENVLEVTDYGKTESGSYYIAMEFLEGSDLAGVLAGGRTMEVARAGDIAVQLCRALAAAHRLGIVHRDLKPDNIFLLQSNSGADVVKIIDFGIAQMRDSTGELRRRMTGQGTFLGTPEYMAPEQVRGGAIDHRADLYALGVVLFRMLAGRTPFWGENVVALKLASFPPAIREFNPDFHHDSLEWVVRRALVRDPDYRFQSADEMRDALTRSLASVWPRVEPSARPSEIEHEREPDPSPTEVSPPSVTMLASHRLRTVVATNAAALLRLETAARGVISAERQPRWQDQWQHRLGAATEFVNAIEGTLLARLDRLLAEGPVRDGQGWIAQRFLRSGRVAWAALLDALPQPLPWGLRTVRKHLQGGLAPSLSAPGHFVAETATELTPETGAHVAEVMGVAAQLSGDLITAGAVRNVLHHRTDYEREPNRHMEKAEELLRRVEFRGVCCIDVPEETNEWLMELAKIVVGRSDPRR